MDDHGLEDVPKKKSRRGPGGRSMKTYIIVDILILAFLNLAAARFSKFAASKLWISRTYIWRRVVLEILPGPKEEASGPISRRVGAEENFFRILPNPIFHFASLYLARGVKKSAKRNNLFPKLKYPL